MSSPSPPIIIDSGATGHFFKISSNLLGIKPTTNGIAVSLPNGALIRSSHTGTLPIPGLPLSACRAHVFPSLQSHSLLSIRQLCDHGCKAVFTHNDVTITRNDLVLLTGTRSIATNGLWTLDPLDPQTTSLAAPSSPITGSVNAMFHTTLAHDTIANRIAFYHASLFPLPSLHGVKPSMPDTFHPGLALHPLMFASTLRSQSPFTKAISTKYEPTFDRLALLHPAGNNQPLTIILKTTWRRHQRTTLAQELYMPTVTVPPAWYTQTPLKNSLFQVSQATSTSSSYRNMTAITSTPSL
jgi:hypothetical protein